MISQMTEWLWKLNVTPIDRDARLLLQRRRDVGRGDRTVKPIAGTDACRDRHRSLGKPLRRALVRRRVLLVAPPLDLVLNLRVTNRLRGCEHRDPAWQEVVPRVASRHRANFTRGAKRLQ